MPTPVEAWLVAVMVGDLAPSASLEGNLYGTTNYYYSCR
jgi:hypothetical protein